MTGDLALDFDGSNDIYEREANMTKVTYHCACCHEDLSMDDFTLYQDPEELLTDMTEFGSVYCDTCNVATCHCDIAFDIYPDSCFVDCSTCGAEGVVLDEDKATQNDREMIALEF